MHSIGKTLLHPNGKFRHLLGRAAVGNAQVVPDAGPDVLFHQFQDLVLNLPAAPHLGHALKLAVGGKGNHRFDAQQGTGKGGHLSNTPALAQVFQGVHREEGEGIFDQLGYPVAHQSIPVHPGQNVLPQLEHHDPHTQGAAFGVEHGDVQVLPGLRLEAHHIIGARQPGGKHDGQHLFIAVGLDAVQGVADAAAVGQRGAGQLSPMEAVIHILGKDVHSVGVFSVVADDLQGHRIDGLIRPQRRGQVGGGIGKQRDLLYV